MTQPIVPSSINLFEQKESMDSGVQQSYTRHTAMGSSYSGGSTVVLEIPTGGNPRFLLPSESYLSFTVTVQCGTITAGGLYLDGTAHSFIQRLRIFHGDELVNEANYGQLANFLIDMGFSASDKRGAEVSLGCDNNVGQLVCTAAALTSTNTYNIPLFAPILGLLTDHGIPVSWMGSAPIRLELDLAEGHKAYTTSESLVENGVAATGVTSPTYTMTNVAYYAKNCVISNDINNGLIEAFGGNTISFPSTGFQYESANATSGSTILNAKVSFQHSSLKNVLWWCQSQGVANGTIVGHRLARGSSSRYLCNINNWYLSIAGEQVPSYRVNGIVNTFSELLRVFDKTSMAVGLNLTRSSFSTTASTAANQLATAGKACAGLDLESSDDQNNVFCGRKTTNDHLAVVAEFGSALSEAQIVHIYGQYDILYSLIDGQLRRSA